MTTKIIDFSDPYRNDQPKNPIEFLFLLNEDDKVVETKLPPSGFDFVEIICEGYSNGYDLFYAYHSSSGRNSGILFFGRANDKVLA
jgi:hypothetical protein